MNTTTTPTEKLTLDAALDVMERIEALKQAEWERTRSTYVLDTASSHAQKIISDLLKEQLL
jgi:uncharacterized protein (DUF1778 family)